MPRSTCKQSNPHCCWLVQLGEGAGFLELARDFTSQHAQLACQLALPAFIRWNSEKKNSPSRGFVVQLRTIDTKNLQRGTALQPRAESPRSGKISGRLLPYEASVSSGSFLYWLSSAKCDVKHPTFERNPVFTFDFISLWVSCYKSCADSCFLQLGWCKVTPNCGDVQNPLIQEVQS